jgi:hypothetical protein
LAGIEGVDVIELPVPTAPVALYALVVPTEAYVEVELWYVIVSVATTWRTVMVLVIVDVEVVVLSAITRKGSSNAAVNVERCIAETPRMSDGTDIYILYPNGYPKIVIPHW